MAITKFDQFDFLIDIVPRDDLKPPKRQVGVANTHTHTNTIIERHTCSQTFGMAIFGKQ